jgi:hypothetical protein
MSMEMHVLFRGKLPSKAALSRTMKEMGFPFSVAPPAGSLEQQSGYMPMRCRRDESGAEFDVFTGRADVEDIAGEHTGNIDPGFDRSANFRWGGDEIEMLASMCASAALAKLVNGVVIEDEEGLLLSVDDAVAFAKKHIDLIVKPEDKRRGTRPADIKRYLKPLLKMRGDLVLVGRLLVVRPVRHLLRGALLDRTSDKYSFRIWRYIQPLYGFAGSVGVGDAIYDGQFKVWQPHFDSLLADVLQADVFDKLKDMTTLADLAQFVENTGLRDKLLTTLVLAGELDRAADYVARIQRDAAVEDDDKTSLKADWDRISSDIEALCTEFHAKEAETVKALKLEHVWEPSPFPVEVPAAERARRTAEPTFSTTPWISRPPLLLGDAPGQPGEICFSKDRLHRDGHVNLLALLTPVEAEERHLAYESYTLTVRLPDGILLLIRRLGRDRNEPEPIMRYDSEHPPWIIIEMHGASHTVQLTTWHDWDDADKSTIELSWINIRERFTYKSVWSYRAHLLENARTLDDYRTEEPSYSNAPITAAEHDLIKYSAPAFGEYKDLVERIRSLLLVTGYGELT